MPGGSPLPIDICCMLPAVQGSICCGSLCEGVAAVEISLLRVGWGVYPLFSPLGRVDLRRPGGPLVVLDPRVGPGPPRMMRLLCLRLIRPCPLGPH